MNTGAGVTSKQAKNVCRNILSSTPLVLTSYSQRLYREAILWRQLKHTNVLPFRGMMDSQEDPADVFLVSPRMECTLGAFVDPATSRVYAVETHGEQLVR
jgi:hypothetical protein